MIKPNQISYHNGKLSKTGKTQDWSVGNQVKVGFLMLTVIDYNGIEYILESNKGVRYTFEPHIGLNKIEVLK